MITVKVGRVPQTNRGSAKIGAQQISQPITSPAPKLGLVTAADMASQEQGSACVLRNFLPTLTGCKIRGGSRKVGQTSDNKPILSMFKYKYGGIEKLFAATGAGIFDVTAPAPPPELTTPVVDELSGGEWTALQHTTAGGSFLICFNGADDRRIFNGTTWTTTPAVTFTDSTTMTQLNYGWLFKNRQFMLKNGTLDAYYLPVNALGGAASLFPLGGVMKKGGSLLTGFSWSVESGDGVSDMCVFVSTEGEVAVYAGSDPSSVDDFSLKGLFQIGKPLGKNAWMRTGGDVLIATTDGLTPVSQVFQRDRGALMQVSLSRPIEDLWRLAATATGAGWTLRQWPEHNLVFVAFPDNRVVVDTTFVLNTLTGRWSTISNWRANCFETLQGGVFFGSRDGLIWRGDIGGTDDGLPFSAVYLSQFAPAGQFGQRVAASLAHLYLRSETRPRVRLFARADFNMTIPHFDAPSTGDIQSSDWDSGLWDHAKWDGVSVMRPYEYRQNVRAVGDTLALGCVITSAGDVRLDIDIDLATLQITQGESSS